MNPHQKKNLNNFAFFGTPELAATTLEILKARGFVPSVIITTPDVRAGRGMHIVESPVAMWAKENGIYCLKPIKIDVDFLDALSAFELGLSVVVAYGKILPVNVITLPEFNTINIHYSLLPKYRGASPVESALLAGDTVTGVSIQQMQTKLDSGPIIAEEKVEIGADETKPELLEKLTMIGAELLAKTLPAIFEGKVVPQAQDESQATNCAKIKKENGQIDLLGNAKENYNKYRAYFGWPGIFFFKDSKRMKITKAKYENDTFIIERVIPEGKKETEYK